MRARRSLCVGLVALAAASGCAALKRTESLPSPGADALPGGPEGENAYDPDSY